MATLTASQLPTRTYTKTKYELRFFSKAQIVACPQLRLSNSFKSLQVRSCAVNLALNNSKQSASNENFENIDMLQPMKIVFVSADISMWSKTRVLGNVLDGLPPAMAAIGKKKIELKFEALEAKYPEKVRILTSFTDRWLHRVIAGADFLIVPSRFEPGGFIQLLAMQYGTLPVVSCTGGLVDTVIDGETGFCISRFSIKYEEIDPSDVLRVVTTLKRAIKVIGTALHIEMIWNCMSQDLSWKGPAKGWERALLRLGVKGSEARMEKEMAPLARENEAEK